MALVPEDGTGVADANSYIDMDYADAYFSDRGKDAWIDADPAVKEVALIDATDYINMRWGMTPGFKGAVATETQSLLWPRLYVGSSVFQMPDTLKRSTAEYAIRALQGPLAPDYPYDDTGRLVIKKREEVGPIVEEVTYDPNSANDLYTPRSYPVPDALIKPILLTAGYGGGLMRN
jgi:hypothetical protein